MLSVCLSVFGGCFNIPVDQQATNLHDVDVDVDDDDGRLSDGMVAMMVTARSMNHG